MPAESVSLTVAIQSRIAEVLSAAIVPSAASVSDRTINHSGGGVAKTVLDTDTPHPVAVLDLEITLDENEFYELNLRAAPTHGAPDAGEDLLDQRLLYIEIETSEDNADPIVVKPATTNGYHLWGSTFSQSFPPFANQGTLHRGQALPIIAASARLIRFEGTEGDSVKVKMCFEDAS
jgi:hypothetical protein